MRTLDVVDQAGISLRQLDWWVRKGWVKARGGRGSGFQRDFTDKEVTVICTAGQLLKIGIVPDKAVHYARAMAVAGTEAVEVNGWILARAEAVEEEIDLAPTGRTG